MTAEALTSAVAPVSWAWIAFSMWLTWRTFVGHVAENVAVEMHDVAVKEAGRCGDLSAGITLWPHAVCR
jgi:hypothetical protein